MARCSVTTDEKVGAAVPSGDVRVWVETTNRRWGQRLPLSKAIFDERHMNLRSTVVWFLFLFLAIMNGGLRNTVLTPRLGEFGGHITSTILLSAAILAVTWLTIGWICPAKSTEALLIGGWWVLMTVAFEFLAGHYVFGSSWDTLLADYNLFGGRIWLLALATSAFAPLIMARARKLL